MLSIYLYSLMILFVSVENVCWFVIMSLWLCDGTKAVQAVMYSG